MRSERYPDHRLTGRSTNPSPDGNDWRIASSGIRCLVPLKDARAAWTEQFELLYVKALLAKTDGNVTKAAELAGVNRRSLQRLIANLNLRRSGSRGPELPLESTPSATE